MVNWAKNNFTVKFASGLPPGFCNSSFCLNYLLPLVEIASSTARQSNANQLNFDSESRSDSIVTHACVLLSVSLSFLLRIGKFFDTKLDIAFCSKHLYIARGALFLYSYFHFFLQYLERSMKYAYMHFGRKKQGRTACSSNRQTFPSRYNKYHYPGVS